jgi:hypothetical protein
MKMRLYLTVMLQAVYCTVQYCVEMNNLIVKNSLKESNLFSIGQSSLKVQGNV